MWQVIGQLKAVELLKHSLESGRLAHAYLFVGQPHVGKTTLAIKIAQAVNCEQEERPCGECRSCRRIADGVYADVQFVGRQSDANSTDVSLKKEIGIDQIRGVQQAAGLKPYEGKRKVFIIESAEHLNEESANCLLKTLEEPPPHVLFMLLAANENRLLPTIISRCQRIELFPVPIPIMEQALVERWGAMPDKARVLSRLCSGGIGWAVSALADEKLLQQHTSRLAELISLASADLAQRFSFAARLATQFSKNRDSVEDTLKLWIGWWRDLLLTKEGCVEFITNADEEAMLRSQAADCTLTEIKGFIEAIQVALKQLEQNANPRLVLEVLMLRLPTIAQKAQVG
ncbi:DNA polymerase III subunit delta' [Chloroflexota bacterium]